MVDDFCRLEAYCFLDCLNGEINLVFEWFSWDVGADGHVRMTDPCVEGALVQCAGLFCGLMSCLVVGQGVKLFSSVCCGVHEDNAVIPLVSQPRPRPSLFIKHSLIRFFGHIGRTICNPSIRKNQARSLAHLCQSSDIILKVHLELDYSSLELYHILGLVFREITEPASKGHYGWYFRDHENLEPALGEVFLDGFQGSAFSSTGTAGQSYAIDGILFVSLELATDSAEIESRE